MRNPLSVFTPAVAALCVCVGRRHVHQPRAAGTSEGREVGRDRLLQAPRRDGGKPQSGASGGRGHEEEPGEWVRLTLIDGRLSRLLCFGLWLLSKGARWSDWFCFIVNVFFILKSNTKSHDLSNNFISVNSFSYFLHSDYTLTRASEGKENIFLYLFTYYHLYSSYFYCYIWLQLCEVLAPIFTTSRLTV